jgi:hypothetical protein
MPSATRGRKRNHNTTRKRKTPMTLPELKGTFDQLRKSCHEIIRSTKDTKQRIRKFQIVWKELFHRPVDAMAADSYLRVMDKGTRNARSLKAKQKGGALTGAPVDFQTRPGVDGVHGSFPQYLTGGLSFYDTINKEGMFQGCGREDITPAVPATLGSNQALAGGGSLADAAFLATTRPSPASVPPNAIQDAQTFAAGQALGASPNASQNPLKYL